MILTELNRVDTVNPHVFCVGDIVEAQVSFIAVPLKNHKYKMIVVLRSIALLDDFWIPLLARYDQFIELLSLLLTSL
jgi:hypothetical protein